MSFQYPHILKLSLSTSAPSLVDGVNVFGDTEELELECRAEPNGASKTINTGSGEAVIFNYTVYMALLDFEIPFNTPCTVQFSETKIVELTVLRHENGQLNSRIWL